MSSSPVIPAPESNGIVVPAKLRWRRRLAGAAIYGLSRALMGSWRTSFEDRSGVLTDASFGPVIFATWHNRLALSMACWHYVNRHRPQSRLAAMISASKDGGLLANVLERFGVTPVRGSTSRRGRQALLEAARLVQRGYDVAITPDGPRGPKYRVQEGIVALAQLTGRPIVPTRVRIRGRIDLRSWDRFQIPLPLARCEVCFAPAMQVGRNTTEAGRQSLAIQLGETMLLGLEM
jgi:lysophospholipid acyltransferase (LPLAT)-like uncharacterized protein